VTGVDYLTIAALLLPAFEEAGVELPPFKLDGEVISIGEPSWLPGLMRPHHLSYVEIGYRYTRHTVKTLDELVQLVINDVRQWRLDHGK
jgi:hypothetical protein